MPRLHIYLKRICPACNRRVWALALDCGEIDTLEALDEKLSQSDIDLNPLVCPGCGSQGWPEELVAWDAAAGASFFRLVLELAEFPITDTGGVPH